MELIRKSTQNYNDVKFSTTILKGSDNLYHYQIDVKGEVFLNGFDTEFQTEDEAIEQALKSAKFHIDKNYPKKKFNKGLTISSEELETIGRDLFFLLDKNLHSGCSSDKFKACREVLKRLEESKNK